MRFLQTSVTLCLTILMLSGCGRSPAPTYGALSELGPEQAANPQVEPTEAPDLDATAKPPIITAEPTPTIQSSPPSGGAELPPLSEQAGRRLSSFLGVQVHQSGDPPQQRAPGAVLLVDFPDGRFLGAAGFADLAEMKLVNPDEAFEIGSITKLFTAVILLQLHEEGVLSLDDKLGEWLPEIAASLPNGEAMTLRQLASHTAGLNDYQRDLYPMPQLLTDQALLERGFEPAEIVQWVAQNKPPLFPPGASGAWQYSNTGYVLLGMVLEAATGQDIGDLYLRRIFEPLGMESAVLLEGIPGEDQIVHGYNAMNGSYADMTRWNASGAWTAGALAMNAQDLATFAHAVAAGELYQNGETLAMMTDFVSTGQESGFTGYGLGLAQIRNGAWGHAGGTPGFGAGLIIDPDSGSVVVFLGNSGSFNVNPVELATLIEQ